MPWPESRSNSDSNLAKCPIIKVGLCAIDKKVEGKPMQELMKRLEKHGSVEFVRFGDDLLLNKPVDEWPECHCLISFYSGGFPLGKAMEYIKRHEATMYSLNSLTVQNHLFDRRWVYKVCDSKGIPTPRHVFCNRGEDERGQLIEGMVPSEDFPPAWKTSQLEEFEDFIVVDGVRIDKPFVEKPASGEDHNVWIYYPRSAGGGIKKLFRKVDNKSSDFCPDENKVRRNGSYIYEEFMTTEGTDVKVYAVGVEYAHAEARKSPVVDGVVARSSDGKEVRYPIILSRRQKDIAKKIVTAFEQTVCGFDLLVCGNKSYVCDVNGWSFVKSSKKFWDDAAREILRVMLRVMSSRHNHGCTPARGTWKNTSSDNVLSCLAESPSHTQGGYDDDEDVEEKPPSKEELRCVIAIIRHADRTPKQKMKLKVQRGGPCQGLLDFMEKIALAEKKEKDKKGYETEKEAREARELKDGKTESLPPQSVTPPPLDTAEKEAVPATTKEKEKEKSEPPLKELKKERRPSVMAPAKLQKDLSFVGEKKEGEKEKKEKVKVKEVKLKTGKELTLCLQRTRKILANMYAAKEKEMKEKEEKKKEASAPATEELALLEQKEPSSPVMTAAAEEAKRRGEDDKIIQKLEQMKAVLEKGGKFEGINRKVQIKPTKTSETPEGVIVTEALVVLKWGGSLTDVGLQQAEVLGEQFRKESYAGDSNSFLRLHNSYRHDLKIYSSDEGRVQMTAASFTKSFLGLEGELTPILVSLVSKDQKAHCMLDPSGVKLHKAIQDSVKETIRKILQQEEEYEKYAPEIQGVSDLRPLHSALKAIGNPTSKLTTLSNNINSLIMELKKKMEEMRVLVERVAEEGGATGDVADMMEFDNGETLRLMTTRWEKLYTDLYDVKQEVFDMSKIPDVYDCCKYDAIHTQPQLGLKTLGNMYEIARQLAELVCPSEYGLTRSQRLDIGSTICRNLIEKIQNDMKTSIREYQVKHRGPSGKDKEKKAESASEEDEHDDQAKIKLNVEYLDDHPDKVEDDLVEGSIKTRLYFTSESHLHSVVNSLRYINVQGVGGSSSAFHNSNATKSSARRSKLAPEIFDAEEQLILDDIPELDYLTQIVFKVFEDQTVSTYSAERFYVRIGISPGVAGNAMENGKKHLDTKPLQWFPAKEERKITWHSLSKALQNIGEHVERSREDLLDREAVSKGGEETAEQRSKRIAAELIREEEREQEKKRQEAKEKEEKVQEPKQRDKDKEKDEKVEAEVEEPVLKDKEPPPLKYKQKDKQGEAVRRQSLWVGPAEAEEAVLKDKEPPPLN